MLAIIFSSQYLKNSFASGSSYSATAQRQSWPGNKERRLVSSHTRRQDGGRCGK